MLTFLASINFILIIVPKVWAKRTNLFIVALGVGYAIKTYVLFTSCYNTYCPEKRVGIVLMMISMLILLLAAIFPHLSLDKSVKED